MEYALLITLLLCLAGARIYAKEDKVIFVAAGIRHGARHMLYPEFYDVVEEKPFKYLPGRLTNIGKHQLYLVGRELYHRYSQEGGLFGPAYSSNDILVRASGLNRTVESAQAMLFGFFPSGLGPSLTSTQMDKVRPPISVEGLDNLRKDLRDAALPSYQRTVPVHTTTAIKDYLFSPHTECDTFKWDEEDLEDDFEKMNDNYQVLYDNLNKILPEGMRQEKWDVDKCYHLRDNIYAAEKNGLNLTFEMDDQTRANLNKCALDDSMNKFLRVQLKSKLLSHIILYDTLNHFNNAIHHAVEGTSEKAKKAAVFLISDAHFMALHKLFGWELKESVPFSSVILFELHMIVHDGGEKEFKVQAYYNGNQMTLKNEDMDKFAQFVKENTFKDEEDFMANCRTLEDSDYDTEFYLAITIILMATLIVLWGSSWYLLVRNKREPEDTEELIITE